MWTLCSWERRKLICSWERRILTFERHLPIYEILTQLVVELKVRALLHHVNCPFSKAFVPVRWVCAQNANAKFDHLGIKVMLMTKIVESASDHSASESTDNTGKCYPQGGMFTKFAFRHVDTGH